MFSAGPANVSVLNLYKLNLSTGELKRLTSGTLVFRPNWLAPTPSRAIARKPAPLTKTSSLFGKTPTPTPHPEGSQGGVREVAVTSLVRYLVLMREDGRNPKDRCVVEARHVEDEDDYF